jgi:hypothetical protein
MKRNLSEHEEQCLLVKWLELNKYKFTAIPNAWVGSIGQVMKMKREGLRGGIPDMLVIVKNKLVWIELKSEKLKPKRGGKGGVSDEQKEWHKCLRDCGNQVFVCYGFDEAREIIKNL